MRLDAAMNPLLIVAGFPAITDIVTNLPGLLTLKSIDQYPEVPRGKQEFFKMNRSLVAGFPAKIDIVTYQRGLCTGGETK